MSLAALPQIKSAERMRVTQVLGYGRVRGWFLAVMPALYAQIRLPIYAVLAYAMSNVDVAMVLGPSRPQTLSMFILRWMTDPDLALRAPAAAAALVQLGLVAAAIMVWRGGERAVAALINRGVESGTRGMGLRDTALRTLGLVVSLTAGIAVFGGLIGQLFWSFAGRWRFPDALPSSFSLISWERHGPDAVEVTLVTLALAFATAIISLVLVIGCLNAELRTRRKMNKTGMVILYLPLILPQIAFLPGLQILMIQIGAAQGILPVVLTHLVFVLPYVFLALAGPYRALDRRYATIGAAMGLGPVGVLWRIRLPMLLAPILTALAVGMAVSVGQYLATLLASGGRLNTLTTEALALFSGGDRRAIGVWTIALAFTAWLPFLLALMIPRIVYRNKSGLRHD
jgi:putative thiamine transport system permease protein